MSGCDHASEAPTPSPATATCMACVRLGRAPVALRMCLTCGHVGCCDSTPGQHATEHYKQTRHPTMRSVEPGDAWAWCYVDACYL